MVLTQHSALLLALTAQPYTVYTYVCTYVWNVSVYIRTYVHCMLSGVFSVYVRIYVLAVCTVCMYMWYCTCVHVHTLVFTQQCIGNVLQPETITIATESDRAWNRNQHDIYSTLHWLMIPICLVLVFALYLHTYILYVCTYV